MFRRQYNKYINFYNKNIFPSEKKTGCRPDQKIVGPYKQCCAHCEYTDNRCERKAVDGNYCDIHNTVCYANADYWRYQHTYEIPEEIRSFINNTVRKLYPTLKSSKNLDAVLSNERLADDIALYLDQYDDLTLLELYLIAMFNYRYRVEKQYHCYLAECADFAHHLRNYIL